MARKKQTHYPLQIKIDAINLIRRGQNIAAAARTLGIARNTLSDWVKAEINGTLADTPADGAQAEISRLQHELARVTLERDLLVKVVVRLAMWKG